MFIIDRGRDLFIERLRTAIETGQAGDQFISQLVLEWRTVHVPILTNLGDKFVSGLKENQEMVDLISGDEGKEWLKRNLDSILDYLQQLGAD